MAFKSPNNVIATPLRIGLPTVQDPVTTTVSVASKYFLDQVFQRFRRLKDRFICEPMDQRQVRECILTLTEQLGGQP